MINDLSNAPLEFAIGAKKYKVKKLSVLDIFGTVEKKIKEEYIENITEMSKILPDKDRGEFLRSAIKEIPSGRKLEDMVNDTLNTTSGGIDILFVILNKCNNVSMDELMDMVTDSSLSNDITKVMSFAMGQGNEEPVEVDDSKKKS